MKVNAQEAAVLAHDPRLNGRVLAGPGTDKRSISASGTSSASLENAAEFAQKMGLADLEGLGVAPPTTVHSHALSLLMQIQGVNLPLPLWIPDRGRSRR